MNLFQYLRRINNKPLLFGIYGALGCLIVSLLLGELLFFLLMPSTPLSSSQALVLLIDTSGSMDQAKLAEVKTAATNFVERQDLNKKEMAVLGFGSEIHRGSPLTRNPILLKTAIAGLADGGGTRMDIALEAAINELQSTPLKKNILLFTDGQPGFQGADLEEEMTKTLGAGAIVRANQINLIAVATGDADVQFLGQLTQDPKLVFYAQSGNFDQAFQSAEQALDSLISEQTTTSNNPLLESILITSLWTALLAMGSSLALIIGQNYFLRRRLLSPKELLIAVIGGLLAGGIAGAIAQLGYTVLSQSSTLAIISRLLGWSLMGTLVGTGMSLFVPNLRWDKAMQGGALGGTIGGMGFLLVIKLLGASIGRLLGATTLGFFLGLMIALLEEISRQAWLLVYWSPKEQTILSLGQQPILLGSSPNSHIYLRKERGYPPLTGKIYLEGEKIYLEFDPSYAQLKSMKNLKQELKNGDTRKLDRLSFEVKVSNASLKKSEVL